VPFVTFVLFFVEIDLSKLDARTRAAVDGQFTDKFHRDLATAIQRQTRTATARRDQMRWREDMVPEYEIDPFVDSLWRQFYGHNYTENPDLMKFLAARNPEIKLKARSGKVQVGYAGMSKIKSKSKSKNLAPDRALNLARRPVRFERGTLELAK
jgi:hypothetical protein